MFARLTIVQVKPDKINETTKLYEESVLPWARSQKGYHGAYLATEPNRKTGKGYSIILWDSEEDAIANEQSGN